MNEEQPETVIQRMARQRQEEQERFEKVLALNVDGYGILQLSPRRFVAIKRIGRGARGFPGQQVPIDHYDVLHEPASYSDIQDWLTQELTRKGIIG